MQFTRNVTKILNFQYLNEIRNKENRKFLEIGCFEGRSVLYLLDNYLQGNTDKIYCIDPWLINDPDRIISENTYELFMNNTRKYHDKMIIKRGYSKDRLLELEDNFFDFIYIDGDHRYEAVKNDAIVSFEKLKVNGYMLFDDYFIKIPEAVYKAVNEFIQVYKHRIRIISTANKQLMLVKLS